jgi:hypothetical protein
MPARSDSAFQERSVMLLLPAGLFAGSGDYDNGIFTCALSSIRRTPPRHHLLTHQEFIDTSKKTL